MSVRTALGGSMMAMSFFRRLPLCLAAAILVTGVLPAEAAAQQKLQKSNNRKKQFGQYDGRAAQTPPLTIDDEQLDLGYVRPGGSVERTVQLRNTGDEPVVIARTAADCACTVAAPEETTIEPGDSVDLTIGYKANLNIGPIRREVRVFCEGYARPFIASIRGESTYGVLINKDGLRGIAQKTGLVTLDSIDGSTFRVVAVNGGDPTYVGFDASKDEPRSSYVLRYDWTGLAVEDLPRWMIIETDHPEAPMMDLRVILPDVQEHNVFVRPGDKFRPTEDRALLPDLSPGEPVELEVAVKGVGRGTADGVTFSLEDEAEIPFDLEVVGHADEVNSGSMTFTLRLTPSAEALGHHHLVLRMKSEDRASGMDVFIRVLPTTVSAGE